MQGMVGGVEGGSWAPFSAFPPGLGAAGQLTLAELEPGGRRGSEERKTWVVGSLARSEIGLRVSPPWVACPQVWPAGPPWEALGD